MNEITVKANASLVEVAAQRIKSSGVIDAAISQIGRTFVIDARKALNLVQNSDTVWAKKYSKKS